MSVIVLFLIFSMLAVLWFDGTSYIIPNWLVSLLFIAYPIAVLMSRAQLDWKMALAGAGIVLVIGYCVFAKKMLGAGDIKLLTACALWTGWDNLPDFLILVGLMGGLFAVGVWCIRRALPLMLVDYKNKKFARIFREGEPVPYGLVISVCFLIMMWIHEIPVLIPA